MARATHSERQDATIIPFPVRPRSCNDCVHLLVSAVGADEICGLLNEAIWDPEEAADGCDEWRAT